MWPDATADAGLQRSRLLGPEDGGLLLLLLLLAVSVGGALMCSPAASPSCGTPLCCWKGLWATRCKGEAPLLLQPAIKDTRAWHAGDGRGITHVPRGEAAAAGWTRVPDQQGA